LFAAAVILIRPLAFIPSLAFAHLPWRDRAQLGWFGPRGLSSLLLILLPIFAGVPGSHFLLSVCCLVVLCSVVLHGFSPMFLLRPPATTTDTGTSAVVTSVSPTLPEIASSSTAKAPITSVSAPQLLASLPDPEFIDPAQLRTLQESFPDQVILADARSRRSFDESPNLLEGAVRLDPDQAVNDARRQNLPPDAVIAVLCA
jgi:sodium/hydrogen antiporter